MPPNSGISKKKIAYKEAHFLNDTQTLQQSLSNALKELNAVGERKEPIGHDSKTYRLINYFQSKMEMLFGNLLIYSEGVNQPLITVNEEAEEYDVSQMEPPNKNQEFLDSILYFGIKDNHVLLVQSRALKSRDLEAYLGWVLQTKTSTIENDNGLVLGDQPPKAIRDKISKSEIRNISVATPILSTSEQKPGKSEKKQFIFTPWGTGADILKVILGNKWFQNYKLKEALDGSNLEVDLKVRYNRTSTTEGLKLLEKIAISMRNAEEDNVTIELKNGTQIRGDDIKISGPVSVRTYGGLVDQNDLFPRMHNWLKEQIKNGLIDP